MGGKSSRPKGKIRTGTDWAPESLLQDGITSGYFFWGSQAVAENSGNATDRSKEPASEDNRLQKTEREDIVPTQLNTPDCPGNHLNHASRSEISPPAPCHGKRDKIKKKFRDQPPDETGGSRDAASAIEDPRDGREVTEKK